MTLTKREATLAKLQALINDKSVNENVAAAAIEKLHAYAADWGINLDDIAAKSDATHASHYRASEPQFSTQGDGWDMVDKFATKSIAEYYACKTWGKLHTGGNRHIIFYGHEVDVEAATTLRWIIRAAMAFEWGAWIAVKRSYSPRAFSVNELVDMKLAFHSAMGDRLTERMAFYHRADSVEVKGTSLVVAKNALTLDHFRAYAEANNLSLFQRRANMSGSNADAARAGAAAGSRVDFGRGISGGETKRIGR